MNLIPGNIYYLKFFTAPKIWTGKFFECLLTDQRIRRRTKVIKDTKINISDWPHEIFRPERFKEFIKEDK